MAEVWTAALFRLFWCFTSFVFLSLSFRMYPIKEVPLEPEALTDWLYQRFVEKEALLAHFYDTGLSRRVSSGFRFPLLVEGKKAVLIP